MKGIITANIPLTNKYIKEAITRLKIANTQGLHAHMVKDDLGKLLVRENAIFDNASNVWFSSQAVPTYDSKYSKVVHEIK